ncbi:MULTISPECIES: hypothetical protein [Brevibacterium]|uniref:PIN domain-containing protein n=2 Tax=Brevibacterium TaxID=1696 RepID=A0ABP9TZC0_9MICO
MTDQSNLVLHDTSVLVNFHRASLLKALDSMLGERMLWSATVARECARLESSLNLPGLTAEATLVLGEPLFPDDDEHRKIRQLRDQFAAPGEHPDEHLGEAEIIAIISARRLKAFIATDDKHAKRIASPIRCVSSWQLLYFAHHRRIITDAEALHFWSEFVSSGGIPEWSIGTETRFMEWLTNDR